MYGQSNQDSPETNCLEIKNKNKKPLSYHGLLLQPKKVFGGITYPCKNGT